MNTPKSRKSSKEACLDPPAFPPTPKTLSVEELCSKLAPLGLQVQAQQRFVLMQLIVNRDRALVDAALSSKDVGQLLQNACEPIDGVTLLDAAKVLSAFNEIGSDEYKKIIHELKHVPNNETLAQALELYRCLGDLKNLSEDFRIIAKGLPIPTQDFIIQEVLYW